MGIQNLLQTTLLVRGIRWSFPIPFQFSPPLGEMIQFDSYFLDGLKPPTTYELSFEEVPCVFFLRNGHCPRSSGDIEAIRTAIDQAAEAGVSSGASDVHGDLRYKPQCHPHLQEIRV